MESLTSRKILVLASTSSSSSSSDDDKSLEETSVSSTSSCDNNFNSSATIHLSSPHRRTIFSSYWKGKDTNLVANCHQNESEKMPIGSSRCILRHPYFELFSESTSFPKHVLIESKYESNPCHRHLDRQQREERRQRQEKDQQQTRQQTSVENDRPRKRVSFEPQIEIHAFESQEVDHWTPKGWSRWFSS